MIAIFKAVSLQLADFSLEVNIAFPTGTTALFGPSGSGKTSILEMLAGLRTPLSGSIELRGRVIVDRERRILVPPPGRKVGYVTQDDTLFPHLAVRQNVLYGASKRNEAIASRFEHITAVLELAPLLDRRVRTLSGGERKRVALARALLANPELLLLDEPLSGIDAGLRTRVLAYLVRVRDEFHVPIIYVTHEMTEVQILCTSIVMLERGRIVEQGPVPV